MRITDSDDTSLEDAGINSENIRIHL